MTLSSIVLYTSFNTGLQKSVFRGNYHIENVKSADKHLENNIPTKEKRE